MENKGEKASEGVEPELAFLCLQRNNMLKVSRNVFKFVKGCDIIDLMKW